MEPIFSPVGLAAIAVCVAAAVCVVVYLRRNDRISDREADEAVDPNAAKLEVLLLDRPFVRDMQLMYGKIYSTSADCIYVQLRDTDGQLMFTAEGVGLLRVYSWDDQGTTWEFFTLG